MLVGVGHGEDDVHVRVELRTSRRGEITRGVEGQAIRARAERAGRNEIGDAALVVGDALGDGVGAAVALEDVEPDTQGRRPAAPSRCPARAR
jgi:hypothetical protein